LNRSSDSSQPSSRAALRKPATWLDLFFGRFVIWLALSALTLGLQLLIPLRGREVARDEVGFRAAEEDERSGLDMAEAGERAYITSDEGM